MIEHALKFCKGNFLFLKTILKYWQRYPAKINENSIPESLKDIYARSFTERFKDIDLNSFEPFLEILLVAYSPLTFIELQEILNYHKNSNIRKVANALSEYFKDDIDQGPLEFHHQFFAEWLVNQTAGKTGIVIEKSRGHQYIFDYLLNLYEERQSKLTFEEISELCAHFFHGTKKSQSNLRRLGSLKVSDIRDNRNRCILHHLASKRDATQLLAEFVKQFNSVDILDFRKWTPVMYAAEAGNHGNVKLFIDNKANLNYVVKRHNCILTNFIFSRKSSYCTESTIISIAICKGYFNIIALLIERGANTEIVDSCGWKPMYFLAMMGQHDMIKLFINSSAKPDAISLHHAVARNHTEIVRLLLDAGVRDECVPCEPWIYLGKLWCGHNLIRCHHCICETALHAAVSRNNLEMAKLILQYGNTSVNCRHISDQSPLSEAISQKNYRMEKLLEDAGARPGKRYSKRRWFGKYLNNGLHFCKYLHGRYKEIDELLYSPSCTDNDSSDNDTSDSVKTFQVKRPRKAPLNPFIKWTPTTVMVVFDQVYDFKSIYGNNINAIPNIKTMLYYVAVCHSAGILNHILNKEESYKFMAAVFADGKTLLHLAILGSLERRTEVYVTQSCAFSACVCPNNYRHQIVNKKRVKTVMLLTQVLMSDINKQDEYGRTALHYAAVQVLPGIVKYLVNEGADWSVKDKRGNTALEYALRERPYSYNQTFQPCQLTSDHVFEVCRSTVFDGLASYLLRMETITKCGLRAKNLLAGLLHHRLPLSLYSLFKSGLDVNCAHEHFIRYLNQTVFSGHSIKPDELLEIFKIFQINVEIVCDVPFGQSELHLMSYIRKHSQVGNLFKPSVNNGFFPLQRFVAKHPKGVEILNECYDKEGYLAIHRAVQGGNIHAVSWFKEIGVDITKKTKSGLTIFVLATVKTFNNDDFSSNGGIEYWFYKRILELIKEKIPAHAFFQCHNSDISPLHVAASLGGITGLQDIAEVIPELPLNCTNSDGILPIYLVYLNDWPDIYLLDRQELSTRLLDLGVSPENKRPLKHPKREVEYHLIYNMFYRTPQHDLRNIVNDDGLFKCPGINDLLPYESEIQEYIIQCDVDCRSSAFEASRKFLSNFPYLDIQHNISNPVSVTFMNIAARMAILRFHLVKTFPSFSMSLEKNLWRKVTNAHSCAFKCSCFEIMKLLQQTFTSEPLPPRWGDLYYDDNFLDNLYVNSFVAERMGWTDRSRNGDVKYRWPFRFLLKKALKKDNAYNYLQILNPYREFVPWSDI